MLGAQTLELLAVQIAGVMKKDQSQTGVEAPVATVGGGQAQNCPGQTSLGGLGMFHQECKKTGCS